MPRIKPYRGDSKNRLNNLVRESQIPKLPVGVTLEFATPKVDESTTMNTSVHTFLRDINGKTLEKDLFYKRLQIKGLNWLPVGELLPYANVTFPTDTHTILDVLNYALGVNLKKEEVVNEQIPSMPANGFVVTIMPGSHAWVEGGELFIYTPGAPNKAARNLDLRIPVNHLNKIRVMKA